MTWTRIMVPLAGTEDDVKALAGARVVAEAFDAELAVVHAPADIADLMPWMGEGFMGGVQVSAIDSLKEAAVAGEKAARVVIAGAPSASSRSFEQARLQAFLAARGVKAETRIVEGTGDAGALLLEAARDISADLLVAGAFGHTRLREYIFGGTTRTLLNSDGPSLFLSH